MITKKAYVLSEIERSTPEVTIFRFRAQDGSRLDFVPGMFAMLYFKDAATGEEIGRAYSIASAPSAECLEFAISMVNGAMTGRLANAKVGDVYYVSAPYGEFKFDFAPGAKVLMLAGGTGVAPFMSALRYARERGIELDANLIYSIRYPDRAVEGKELKALLASNSKLRLTITVTRPQPGDGWTGQTGHIDGETIRKHAPDYKERMCYICGPPAFVKALNQSLLDIGMPKERIRAEMWG